SFMIQEKIDILLVAGDLFDTAYPPLAAQEMYHNFLADAFKQSYPSQVIITDGNHDGRANLRVPKSLLKSLHTEVVCELDQDLSKHLIPVEINGEKATIAAVPFLRDQDLRKSIAGTDDPAQAIREGIKNTYQEIANFASSLPQPLIGMGHLYVQGVSLNTEDAERPIQMGHQAAVDSSYFPKDFHYVALGHIHKAQKISGEQEIHYSGSPYPLSFSEIKYEHQVKVITVEEGKIISITPVKTPAFKILKRLKGSLEKIKEQATSLQSREDGYLLEIAIEEPLYDPMTRTLADEWKHAFHKKQDFARIIKTTIHFEQHSQNAAQLFRQQHLKEDEFTASKIFDKMLEESQADEALKQDLRNTFTQLNQNILSEDYENQ
ncbi:exonuclease subunit SbcD, partial [Persicobacter diffluens]|uniref:exonuclease subunit SbcD n=1 Tax=Persicobacter diffluens TaxID=981 RepID=UPI0030C679AC